MGFKFKLHIDTSPFHISHFHVTDSLHINLIRSVSRIQTTHRRPESSERRRVAHTATGTDTSFNKFSVKIDNHADTTCAGKNCIPLHCTGQVCNAQPFSDSCDATENVPIGGVATVHDDPRTEESILIEMHEVLMFTESMKHTLLNPDQAGCTGHSLCDDPCDPHRSLFIAFHDTDYTISLKANEVVIEFPTRRPTQEELHQLRRFALTEDTP